MTTVLQPAFLPGALKLHLLKFEPLCTVILLSASCDQSMAANRKCSLGVVFSIEEDDDNNIDQSSSSSSEVEEEHFHGNCSFSADISESERSFCSSSSASTSALRRPPPLPPDQVLDFAFTCDLPTATTKRPTVMFPVVGDRHVFIPAEKPKRPELTEVKLIKERFAKLLLGEDMSGGGNGVCSALAISNAITNLAATVFGKLWKVEPLPPAKKSMWVHEMEWLLHVCDSIVELVPSVQELPGGRTFEVMVPQPRPDLSLNLPALKKLDVMLIRILDEFCDSEFYYVDRGIIVADGEYIEARVCPPSQERRPSIRLEEKWWLPFPKVPKNGLSQETRKHLQQSWKCTKHIYKAALAINNTVLSEMEVPKVYLYSLPKSGKACLGETLYHYVTANEIPTECLVDYLDLTSEHSTLEIANKLEAASQFWRQKCCNKDLNDKRTGRLLWGGSIKGFFDIDKCKISAQRADSLLRNLKHHFPRLPQTALDTTKKQHNKDVGQAILESYSRVIESLAFNLMARIEDLLYVDDATRIQTAAESMSAVSYRELTGAFNLQNHVPPSRVSVQLNSCATLLKKPAFCPAAHLVKKMKRIHGPANEELDENLKRLTF